MDFLKLLRSLEEFLYEAITWLVFYPRTLWRILLRPLTMVAYARAEASKKDERQFIDAISPPLMLMLTIGLSHLAELAMHQEVKATGNAMAQAIFGSEQNLLIYRSIGYSVWPLVCAVGMLMRTHAVLNRETLRAPFFAQCFLMAPLALGQTLAFLLIRQSEMPMQVTGLVLFLLSFTWYFIAQLRWVRLNLEYPWWRVALVTCIDFAVGSAINIAIGALILV